MFEKLMKSPQLIALPAMPFKKIAYFLLILFCWAMPAPLFAGAEETTLDQTVEKALNYSPRLKAQTYNYDASGYDLKRSRGNYFPVVDLQVGYGLEQHSDSVTRQSDADPSSSDWRSRQDATLKLTQKVYDGGETSHQVSIQKALLDVASFRTQEATQAVSMGAIIAHLEVYRQRQLVVLAEKTFQVHRDIYQSLVEMEQAGAGNLADVAQTQARMARAQSNLFITGSDLDRAIANYQCVVGVKPGELAYAGVPDLMPDSLEEALRWTELGNPELLALDARIREAEAKVGLVRSAYKPKINIELSSCYNDQVKGDPSWENTHDAMLNLRWNLFNGGQDKAEENAALSRKRQSRSNKHDRMFELREKTTAAWTNFLSLQSQKKSNKDAVVSSEQTFDAYLKQFSVSQRSLVDVLNAQRDYFQAARQLVTVSVDEIIAAYHILMLGGKIKPSLCSKTQECPENFQRLSKMEVFPSVAHTSNPPAQNLSIHPPKKDPLSLPHDGQTTPKEKIGTASFSRRSPLHSIEIGPCFNKRDLKKVNEILQTHKLVVHRIPETRTVKFTRLLEGVYSRDKAYKRLEELKKTFVSAFILPKEKRLAIYLASFHDVERANRYARLLKQKGIEVTQEEAEIEMQGTMLVVQKINRQTAEIIAKKISEIGLDHTLKNLQT